MPALVRPGVSRYAHGYIDGLYDEGELSVEAAKGLKKTAVMRRDKRLSDLGGKSHVDPKWAEMAPFFVVEFVRSKTNFDAAKVERMLQFAIDAAR